MRTIELQILIFTLLFAGNISACYITACRTRFLGKRVEEKSPDKPLCRPCGPGSLGQCYGPEFCCGPFGCIVGREELSECSQAVPTKLVTCYSDYRSCKKLERGVCAAEHFCCNQDTCMSTEECSGAPTKMMDRERRRYILSSILSKIKSESSYTTIDNNSAHQKSDKTVSTIQGSSLRDENGDEVWRF